MEGKRDPKSFNNGQKFNFLLNISFHILWKHESRSVISVIRPFFVTLQFLFIFVFDT